MSFSLEPNSPVIAGALNFGGEPLSPISPLSPNEDANRRLRRRDRSRVIFNELSPLAPRAFNFDNISPRVSPRAQRAHDVALPVLVPVINGGGDVTELPEEALNG